MPITMTKWLAPGQDPADDPLSSNGYCLYTKELSSKLVFGFLSDGIRVFIETDHNPIGIADLEPWASAYQRASNQLTQDEPYFKWWASIGSRTIDASETVKITEPTTLKDITILPAVAPYTEGVDAPGHPALGGANLISSFPLVTHGKSRGYNWRVAAQRATHDLNAICCLLSLEFSTYWTIRSYPNHYHSDEPPSVILPEWGFGLESAPTGIKEHAVGSPRETVVPQWFEGALERIRANAALNSAVYSHRQGLALMEEHPSLALICFVSSIEGVGVAIEEPTRCTQCGAHSGAQKRFRGALKTAFSNKEIKDLKVMEVYDLRSQTAHAGTLHG